MAGLNGGVVPVMTGGPAGREKGSQYFPLFLYHHLPNIDWLHCISLLVIDVMMTIAVSLLDGVP